MLTHRVPFPPDRGDRIRAYHLLRFLANRTTVDLACLSPEGEPSPEQRASLQALTDRLLIHPTTERAVKLRGLLGLLRGDAVTPSGFFRRPLARNVIAWHHARPFEAVLTFCTGMAAYPRALRQAEASWRHVLDLVDVDSQKWAQLAESAAAPRRWVYRAEARRLQRWESGQAVPFDVLNVVTPREALLYREAVRDDLPEAALLTAGNGVDASEFPALPPPEAAADSDPDAIQTLAFVGVMDYAPNVDAARWLVHQVMPRLREQVPGAKLKLIGQRPSPAVQALHGRHGTVVTGRVDSVPEALKRVAVCAAPLAMSRGVQNKVLQAMACRRAVVCNTPTAQGLEHAQPGKHLKVADSPDAMASAVRQLMQNPSQRDTLAQQGRSLIETAYRWEHRLAPLAKALGLGPN